MAKKQFPSLTGLDTSSMLDNAKLMGKSVQQRADQWRNDIEPFAKAFSDFPNTRTSGGITNRREQIMSWRIPNGSVVQMYINPQNLTINEEKQINTTRTKGGFVVQYWGENLIQITLSGHTGSAGIEGINVLRDIYRSEMKVFDSLTNLQVQELQRDLANISLGTASVSSMFNDMAESIRKQNFLLKPTLASLACSVLLFYQGVQYRGFFKSFQTTESVDPLGLISYNINFVCTEVRGRRRNYLPWSKSPVDLDIVNGLLNSLGNSIRNAVGLQPQAPQSYHPENAPLSFGPNNLITF